MLNHQRKFSIVIVLLLFFNIGYANNEVKVECKAIRSIDKILKIKPNTFEVYCKRGIGMIEIHNPKENTLVLHLKYDQSKWFKRLEGLEIHDLKQKQRWSLDELKKNKQVQFKQGILNLTLPAKHRYQINIIDAYRH